MQQMIQKHFTFKGLFVLMMVASLVWACGEAETPPAEEPAVVEEVMTPDTMTAPIDTLNTVVDTTTSNRPSNRQK
jgi:hypothetical protein